MKKRKTLPSIDRDPNKQNSAVGLALQVDRATASKELGNIRPKDHRSELMGVLQSNLLRSSFPKEGADCIHRIVSLLDGAQHLVHAHRADIGPALSSLMPRPGEASCLQVLGELDPVYQHVLGVLGSAGLLSEHIVESLGLTDSITEVEQENRVMHQFSSSLRSLARAHAGASEKSCRDASVLLGFLSQVTRALTPVRVKLPFNGCVLCHRYALNRLICSCHPEEQGGPVSPSQRKRYRETLEQAELRLEQACHAHRSLLTKILAREVLGLLRAQDAMDAFELLLADPLSKGVVDLRKMWAAALEAGSAGASPAAPEFSMFAAALAWHLSKSVADPEGAKRLEQPVASLLLHALSDASRFDGFVACGGERLRQTRRRIALPQ